jgi:RNA binding exosome subunit
VRTTYAEDAVALRARIEAYPAKKEIALKKLTEGFHAS